MINSLLTVRPLGDARQRHPLFVPGAIVEALGSSITTSNTVVTHWHVKDGRRRMDRPQVHLATGARYGSGPDAGKGVAW